MRFGRIVPEGWLPVHSCDTEEEAKALIVAACETNINGDYVARELAHEQRLENLGAFAARLREVEARMKKRQVT